MEQENDNINIYEDVCDFDLGDQVEKLKTENEILQKHIHSLEDDIEKLTSTIVNLRENENTLKTNISTLYLTAKAEIERKDRMISELRTQNDDMCFRRLKAGSGNKRERESEVSEDNTAKKIKSDSSNIRKEKCVDKLQDHHNVRSCHSEESNKDISEHNSAKKPETGKEGDESKDKRGNHRSRSKHSEERDNTVSKCKYDSRRRERYDRHKSRSRQVDRYNKRGRSWERNEHYYDDRKRGYNFEYDDRGNSYFNYEQAQIYGDRDNWTDDRYYHRTNDYRRFDDRHFSSERFEDGSRGSFESNVNLMRETTVTYHRDSKENEAFDDIKQNDKQDMKTRNKDKHNSITMRDKIVEESNTKQTDSETKISESDTTSKIRPIKKKLKMLEEAEKQKKIRELRSIPVNKPDSCISEQNTKLLNIRLKEEVSKNANQNFGSESREKCTKKIKPEISAKEDSKRIKQSNKKNAHHQTKELNKNVPEKDGTENIVLIDLSSEEKETNDKQSIPHDFIIKGALKPKLDTEKADKNLPDAVENKMQNTELTVKYHTREEKINKHSKKKDIDSIDKSVHVSLDAENSGSKKSKKSPDLTKTTKQNVNLKTTNSVEGKETETTTKNKNSSKNRLSNTTKQNVNILTEENHRKNENPLKENLPITRKQDSTSSRENLVKEKKKNVPRSQQQTVSKIDSLKVNLHTGDAIRDKTTKKLSENLTKKEMADNSQRDKNQRIVDKTNVETKNIQFKTQDTNVNVDDGNFANKEKKEMSKNYDPSNVNFGSENTSKNMNADIEINSEEKKNISLCETQDLNVNLDDIKKVGEKTKNSSDVVLASSTKNNVTSILEKNVNVHNIQNPSKEHSSNHIEKSLKVNLDTDGSTVDKKNWLFFLESFDTNTQNLLNETSIPEQDRTLAIRDSMKEDKCKVEVPSNMDLVAEQAKVTKTDTEKEIKSSSEKVSLSASEQDMNLEENKGMKDVNSSNINVVEENSGCNLDFVNSGKNKTKKENKIGDEFKKEDKNGSEASTIVNLNNEKIPMDQTEKMGGKIKSPPNKDLLGLTKRDITLVVEDRKIEEKHDNHLSKEDINSTDKSIINLNAGNFAKSEEESKKKGKSLLEDCLTNISAHTKLTGKNHIEGKQNVRTENVNVIIENILIKEKEPKENTKSLSIADVTRTTKDIKLVQTKFEEMDANKSEKQNISVIKESQNMSINCEKRRRKSPPKKYLLHTTPQEVQVSVTEQIGHDKPEVKKNSLQNQNLINSQTLKEFSTSSKDLIKEEKKDEKLVKTQCTNVVEDTFDKNLKSENLPKDAKIDSRKKNKSYPTADADGKGSKDKKETQKKTNCLEDLTNSARKDIEDSTKRVQKVTVSIEVNNMNNNSPCLKEQETDVHMPKDKTKANKNQVQKNGAGQSLKNISDKAKYKRKMKMLFSDTSSSSTEEESNSPSCGIKKKTEKIIKSTDKTTEVIDILKNKEDSGDSADTVSSGETVHTKVMKLSDMQNILRGSIEQPTLNNVSFSKDKRTNISKSENRNVCLTRKPKKSNIAKNGVPGKILTRAQGRSKESTSESSTTADEVDKNPIDNTKLIDEKLNNLIQNYIEDSTVEICNANVDVCKKSAVKSVSEKDVVNDKGNTIVQVGINENNGTENQTHPNKIIIKEVIIIADPVNTDQLTKCTSNDIKDNPSNSCGGTDSLPKIPVTANTSTQNTPPEKTKVRRRITPTPVRDDKPFCSFKNILGKDKCCFSEVSPLHLTHEGEIPVLHLEENHISNLPTETNINDRNIISLLDTMNISNMECDIPKINCDIAANSEANSGDSARNVNISPMKGKNSLTFENMISKVTSTPMTKTDCQSKDNSSSNAKSGRCVSSNVTPVVEHVSNSLINKENSSTQNLTIRRRKRRCWLVVTD